MTDLVPKSPAHDVLPIEHGQCRLTEPAPKPITWLAPFKGQTDRVSEALTSETGCGLAAANRITSNGGIRVISIAPGEVLIIGASFTTEGAACVDQSDAWAVIELGGAHAHEVLARVTPIDVRPDAFQVGHTARTLLGHMTASISRIDDATFEVMVLRSMAKTAVHDLSRAMKAVAARHALPTLSV